MRPLPLERVICATALLIGQSANILFSQAAFALDVEQMIKDGIKNQLPSVTQQSPIKVEHKSQKIEDLIQRQDIPFSYPVMIPLQGISISGLGPKAIMSLGENYFVVRSNTGVTKMSELYKENRNNGKANYVTSDCVLHPYIAFTNRIYADLIKRHLLPLSKSLLFAMLKVAVSDYRHSEDAEVRTDIEANAAFLSLALKLIDPSFPIPPIGRVPKLVQTDYDSLVFAKPGRSVIFDRDEDFAFYKPQGWYKSSPELITFHRLKTWLSRLNYPINDVSYDSGGVKGNNFRRSVLLYRCLDLARIDNKAAYEQWVRLVKGMFLLGSQMENWQEKNLYPHDYKGVFKTSSASLQVTLNALSEPLYRTKLLLAVRKQKPLSLGSTSIFDIEETQTGNSVAAFRLFPSIGSPEDPWLNWAAALYPKPGVSTNLFPVALMDLSAWGAPQASNFLLDSSWAMDENTARAISEVKRWVLRRSLTGQVQPVDSRLWNMLSPSWRLLPEGIQTAVRCEMWANRRMETAFSAWLDSKLSITPLHMVTAAPSSSLSTNPPDNITRASSDDKIGQALANLPLASTSPAKQGVGASKATATATPGRSASAPVLSGQAGSRATLSTGQSTGAGQNKIRPAIVRRAARGHFLDPYPDLYNRVLVDAQNIERELTALNMPLEPNLKRGLDDYTKLFQRFFKIAKDEVDCRPLAPADLNLLANIDMILEKIDLPVPGLIHYNPPQGADKIIGGGQSNNATNKGSGTNAENSAASAPREAPEGFTFALGRPGMLYIILMNKGTQEWTLARGAVYTFYEQHGTGLSEESLLNKIDKGTIQPPYWTERFDFVQAEKK